MSKKIAKIDAEAMNSLFASELTKMGVKVAAKDDDKGIIDAPQAFADHQEYLDVVKSVLAEDSKTDMQPNDPLVD